MMDLSRLVTHEGKLAAARAAEARAYLAATDWMVIRAAEGGPAVPPDIARARQAARQIA